MELIKTDFELLNKNINESQHSNLSILAKECKITQKQLSLIVAGKAEPTSDIMYKLVDILGIQHKNAGEIFFSTRHK